MNYDMAYSTKTNTQFSIIQEPNISYSSITYYLTMTSLERDTNVYPNPNYYHIDLPQDFKNIYSIELLQSIIPQKTEITNQPFLLLQIPEFYSVITSNTQFLSSSFATLPISVPTNTTGYLNITHHNNIKIFNTPKSTLSKITIKLALYDNSIVDFSGSSGSSDIQYQNYFTFKITCLEKNRSNINHRNVF